MNSATLIRDSSLSTHPHIDSADNGEVVFREHPIYMVIETDAPYDDDWHAAHRATVGSSMSAAILGESDYDTPLDAYHYLTGATPPDDLSGNRQVMRGNELEQRCLQGIAERIGFVRPHDQCVFVYSEDCPHMHALPDGWHGPNEVVEAKCPNGWTIRRIKSQGLPKSWILQAQHQIAVCNVGVCHLGVWDCDKWDVMIFEIERDDELCELIRNAVVKFYADHITPGIPPIIASEPSPLACYEFAEHQDKIELSDPTIVSEALEFLDACELEKQAKELKVKRQSNLKRYLKEPGKYKMAGVPEWFRLAIQPGRKTFDHKAAVKENPELARYYKEGKPFEVLSHYSLSEFDK